MLKDKIISYRKELESLQVADEKEAEKVRVQWLGKKGILQQLMNEFRELEPERKKEIGKILNDLKKEAEEKIAAWKEKFSGSYHQVVEEDITLPPYPFYEGGGLHPITIVKNEIIRIFHQIGFTVSEGPQIEDDWHNFTALNTPEDHPARDMQDTFYISMDLPLLLRTHTSSVQVRVMEKEQLPIRTISPGRVFRNETVSARAHFQFHQVEGLYVDKGVSLADLKMTLLHFVQNFFGKETKTRMRPSYFPFTEPSAELDVECTLCKGKGCPVCKQSGWLEILGCGMVDPSVLQHVKINPDQWSGFAFGMGLERLAMLRYRIPDLRMFFENDLRFLRQFRAVSLSL